MSIFQCTECGCIENTAVCRYWIDYKFLCSQCHPEIKQWHNRFERKDAQGLMVDEEGFLYSQEPSHTRIIGVVPNREGKI